MSTKVRVPVKAAPTSSFTPSASGLLQRKCACGGKVGLDGACVECRPKRILDQQGTAPQAKLAINESHDKYEREAAHVADQVMRMRAPRLQSQDLPQREMISETSSTAPRVQRRVDDAAAIQFEPPPTVDNVLRSGGKPLDASMRALMEPRFGHDFSRVRVHTDARAAASAQTMNAHAYTVGNHVVFGAGTYSAETDRGRHLIAHELTHVVQQNAGIPGLQRLAKPACAATAGKKVSNDTGKNNVGEFGWCIFENAGSNGVAAQIEFDADSKKTECDSLNWIQNVRSYKGAAKTTFYPNNDIAYYSAFDIGTGTRLDHSKTVGETNPLYNTGPGALSDTPALRSIAGKRGQSFETSPFCAKGKEEGFFYGGISWGWDLDAAGTFSLQAPTVDDNLSVSPPLRAPDMFQTLDKFLGVKAQAGFNRKFVEFAFNSSALDASAKKELDKVSKRLTDNPDEQAWLIGNADSVGTDQYNLELSLRRSKAVEAYLVTKGIGADRLFITGFGESMPKVVTENKSRENRRVEIFVIDPARKFAL